MKIKEQIDILRSQMINIIREAVEKENGCIGTFYKNRGERYFISQIKEEYVDVILVCALIPFLDTYGSYIGATVFDLYLDSEQRVMCTLNGESGEDFDEPLEHIQIEGLLSIVDWLQAQGFITKKPDSPYRCEECGSCNIQKMAWVLPNEENRFVKYCSDTSEKGDHWCEDCEEHTEILSEDKLIKIIDEWWKKLSIYKKEEIARLWLYDYNPDDRGQQDFLDDATHAWNEFTNGEKIEKWKNFKE